MSATQDSATFIAHVLDTQSGFVAPKKDLGKNPDSVKVKNTLLDWTHLDQAAETGTSAQRARSASCERAAELASPPASPAGSTSSAISTETSDLFWEHPVLEYPAIPTSLEVAEVRPAQPFSLLEPSDFPTPTASPLDLALLHKLTFRNLHGKQQAQFKYDCLKVLSDFENHAAVDAAGAPMLLLCPTGTPPELVDQVTAEASKTGALQKHQIVVYGDLDLRLFDLLQRGIAGARGRKPKVFSWYRLDQPGQDRMPSLPAKYDCLKVKPTVTTLKHNQLVIYDPTTHVVIQVEDATRELQEKIKITEHVTQVRKVVWSDNDKDWVRCYTGLPDRIMENEAFQVLLTQDTYPIATLEDWHRIGQLGLTGLKELEASTGTKLSTVAEGLCITGPPTKINAAKSKLDDLLRPGRHAPAVPPDETLRELAQIHAGLIEAPEEPGSPVFFPSARSFGSLDPFS